ncbi:outer membrane beta-barrel protein [Rufibacter soli]
MKKSPAEQKQGQSVEEVFRNGLADAEATPPPRIWENLDTLLENQELHHYRKQAKWYRSIAAAAVLLFISFAVFFWRSSNQTQQPQNGLASVSSLHGPSTQEKAKRANPSPEKPDEKLAAVSEPFSEKQAQKRNSKDQPLAAAGSYRPTPGEQLKAMGNNSLNQRHTTPARMEREPETGNSNASLTGPSLATSFPLAQDSMLGLTTSALAAKGPVSLPVGGLVDSVQYAQANTILRQKQVEEVAVAVAAPAEKDEMGNTQAGQRWSLAVAYSPQYAYSPVKIGQANSAPLASFSQPQMANDYQEAVEEYNNSYSPAYSYSTLVGATYQINEKWQLESGMLYTQSEATTTSSFLVSGYAEFQGFQGASLTGSTKNVPLVANALHTDGAAGGMSVSRTGQYTTKYKYQQVGLPLRVAYKHAFNRFFGYLAGGVHVNLLLQNSITPESRQVEALRFSFNDQNSPYKAWQLATSTAVGVGYELSKNMSLLVAPELNYSLTPLLKEGQKQPDAFQVGVSVGGRWRLGK